MISVPLCFKTSSSEYGDVLTLSRDVEAEVLEDDGVPFAARLDGSNCELASQCHESEKLQAVIRDNMQKRGFALPEGWGMSRLCEEDENTEAQRTQSFPSGFSSVISVPPCFKTSSSEHGDVLSPVLRT